MAQHGAHLPILDGGCSAHGCNGLTVLTRTGGVNLPPHFCATVIGDLSSCPEVADAAKRWSLKALDDGGARLYYASESAGHSEARREAGHAADALFIASVLVVDPALRRVLRLMARRVVAALDEIGHPNGDELLVISKSAAGIRSLITWP